MLKFYKKTAERTRRARDVAVGYEGLAAAPGAPENARRTYH